MPTYDYGCKSGKVKEIRHSITKCDTIEVACDCGKPMNRLITGGTGFLLKGDGWVGRDLKERNSRTKHSENQQKKMEEHAGDKRIKSIAERKAEQGG